MCAAKQLSGVWRSIFNRVYKCAVLLRSTRNAFCFL